MWKTSLYFALNKIVRTLIGNGIFNEIEDLVVAYMDKELTGDEKKAAVKKELNELKGVVGVSVKEAGSVLINLAIETVLIVKNK